MWYAIPGELKNSESLACFKTNVKKYWLVDGDVDVTQYLCVKASLDDDWNVLGLRMIMDE